MAKVRINDVIIVLPGITGSVLQKDGKDVWAASGTAIWKGLTSNFASIKDIKIAGEDDPDLDDLGDGIQATRLIDDVHIVPGLFKITGYTGLRSLFSKQFEVRKGSLVNKEPANYFEFPYDWRRHNRVSARMLKYFVDERLKIWRDYTGNKKAKIILIAHSMGGLVSRYFLEVLGGWRDCRALFTFGTPFRGSINAVNMVANGYKNALIDLTETMRTFTAVYQLLPRYRAIKIGNEYVRAAETDAIPNLSQDKAQAALDFIYEIDDAIKTNQKFDKYQTDGYLLKPLVGIRQKTYQSAVVVNDKLEAKYTAPDLVQPHLADGDSTVPRVSAIPVDMSDQLLETYRSEKHANLQDNDDLLQQLYQWIKLTQSNIKAIRGADPAHDIDSEPAISLSIDDYYSFGEPVVISADTFNLDDYDGEIIAKIQSTMPGERSIQINLCKVEQGYEARLEGTTSGSYQITLEATKNAIPQVKDIFVIGAESVS